MKIILDSLIEQGFSKQEARAALKDWRFEPIIDNGVEVGELMLKENEIHFALKPEHRMKLGRRRMMWSTIDRLLDEHDFLVTQMFNHDKLIPLVKYMGFRQINKDNQYTTLWLDKETRHDRH